MTLHTQDWINIAIATGTACAAIGSWRAAISSKHSVETMKLQSNDEKDRWLTNLLLSVASQCNNEINENGLFRNQRSGISRIATICHDAIDLIDLYSPEESKNKHLKTFWTFLHSSIWAELKSRDKLKEYEPKGNSDDIYPNAQEFYNLVKKQYDRINLEIINKIT